MQWAKSKLTVHRWTSPAFRITETLEIDGRPFTLESLNDDEEPPGSGMGFDSLEGAKAHADLLNDLTLERADNKRLRAELDERAGKWPPPLEDEDRLAAQRFDGITDGEDDRPIEDGYDTQAARHLPDDGRGIPAPRLASHG